MTVYDGNHMLPTALPTSDSPKGDIKRLEVGKALGADSGAGVDNASPALAAPGISPRLALVRRRSVFGLCTALVM